MITCDDQSMDELIPFKIQGWDQCWEGGEETQQYQMIQCHAGLNTG